MYENGTRRPVESVLRRQGKGRGRANKENNGGNKSNTYCEHFCKCHNVPLVEL
jgi:hypothetical protein